MTIARQQLSKRGVYKTRQGGIRNPARDYTQYNSDPTTYKVDRERADPKYDRSRSIMDSKGFKDALGKIQKEFGSRINPDKKRLGKP